MPTPATSTSPNDRSTTLREAAARELAALWPAWFDAAARPAIDAAIRALHAELDAAVDERGPRCDQSGRCCRFDDYGHRLYVTGLEAAWFLRHVEPAGPDSPVGPADGAPPTATTLPILRPDAADGADGAGGCPYQRDRRCGVHADRPLGCRVFFCEPGTEAWQHDLYERFHERVRALHERHGVAYRYLEWRAALASAKPLHA